MKLSKYTVAIIIFGFILPIIPATLGIYFHLSNSKLPTVVKIKVESDYGKWEGSGVFIADDLILTAGHIVEDANTIWIIWPDGRKRWTVDWYQETEADLGIIHVKTYEKEPTAKFNDAMVGETVKAIGYPYYYYPVLTQGIISAIDVEDDHLGGKNVFITDCPLVPGNSGCPIFDTNNNILGICSWQISNKKSMSFCVPAKICQLVIGKYQAIKNLEGAK